MQAESSYGWLVARDRRARADIESYLEVVYDPGTPWAGLPPGPPGFLELDTWLLVTRYVSNPRPAFTRLPFDYRLVPSPIRAAGLAVLDRLHASEAAAGFPQWPFERRLDDLRASVWARAASRAGRELEVPTYPAGRPGAVILTHDIDSRRELAGVLELRKLERRFELTASFGFIPEVSWPDRDLIDELIVEGCEVYCHDERHDGKLPYKNVRTIANVFERFFDSHAYTRDIVRGFRSGQLLMTPVLLRVLRDWFEYDLSLPDTERGGPYGSTAGCATVYPFLIDGLLEIPLTLPQDFYLANVERYDASRMQAVWRQKLDAVLACGGVAVVNTHPIWTTPQRPGVWASYEGLLEAIVASNAWATTPSQLRAWLLGRRDDG